VFFYLATRVKRQNRFTASVGFFEFLIRLWQSEAPILELLLDAIALLTNLSNLCYIRKFNPNRFNLSGKNASFGRDVVQTQAWRKPQPVKRLIRGEEDE